MKWTREHPEAPTKLEESKWYWFWPDNEDNVLISEIWPNRGLWKEGWWGEEIKKPNTKPERK